MTNDRRQQIKEVFHAARECPAEGRIAYLDDVCGADEELRQEVNSLLLAYEELGDFMQQPLLPVRKREPSIEQIVLVTGQQVGPYRIERHLGSGGMGVIYLARDTRLGRHVTLKLLPPRFTQERERMRRFQQEARAASALNHPNLLTIYEVGQMEAEAGGAYYIVAEFVQGQTLRELFRDDTMQLGQALDLAIQLTEALAAAHQAGIIHRDIKPENVMLRPDGIVKVLDFGLAKLIEQKGRREDGETGSGGESGSRGDGEWGSKGDKTSVSSSSPLLTAPGIVIGTVAYMSPEQARGVAVDARSDLFSVGTVLYELLTGRKPFQGETQSDVLAALLEREPPPLTYYVAGLPAALQQIVTRALVKAPAGRYQSAQEFGAALKQLKQELEFAAHLSRSNESDPPLKMKVGTGALGHEVTQFLLAATGEQKSSLAFRSAGHARSRSFRLILLAPLLLTVGILLGRFWWQPNGTALNAVAVLPFISVGNDAQKAYLPDAITENLIDSLTRLPALSVSSRSTVMSYKGREVDPRQVGKELHVGAVVTGRVTWQGEKLIVRVELVDTSDGSRVWGDEFQQPHADILTIQGAIVREIAAKLQRRLTPENQQQFAKRHTADNRAYELYAQGRYLYLQYKRESQEKALEYYRQAIALDSHYALAYCGIADVYADFSSQYLPPSEAMPKAREAALKALELDESLPEAHHSLALVKLWGDWDWAGAERAYKRALELNPNLVHTRIYYAELLSQQKRFEEALREVKRAEEYDPASSQALWREASINFYMRQYDRALAIWRNILELDPKHTGAQLQIAVTLGQQGLSQEGLAAMKQLATSPLSAGRTAWLAYFYACAGQRREALKLLRDLEAFAVRERISPLSFVRIHLALGDQAQAFAWLRRALAERNDHLLFLGVDPLFDPLRLDPRFSELLRGIGLAP